MIYSLAHPLSRLLLIMDKGATTQPAASSKHIIITRTRILNAVYGHSSRPFTQQVDYYNVVYSRHH